jgi:signal peptidase II
LQLSKKHIAILTIFLVLIADQILKIWIKTNMVLGENIYVLGDWFILHFTENEGMAFGLLFGGKAGKLALSIFRVIAVCGIGWYLASLLKKNAPVGLIVSLGLIMGGALGNIIDSLFYGLIFSESTHFLSAVLFPENGGYAPLFFGKVVDMFYFPIIKGYWPSWSPIKAGDYFEFFRPVFNLADAAISVGVGIILIWQKKFFKDLE